MLVYMEIPTTAGVNYGPIILPRDPRDNPTPEKTFISLVQGQPDQTWVQGKGMGMLSLPAVSLTLLTHSLPLLFQSNNLTWKTLFII